MNKISIVIKREYIHRVSKKSFWLITFLIPIITIGVLFVPLWLSTFKSDEIKNILINDITGKYATLFENTDEYSFSITDRQITEFRNNPEKEVFAILTITEDLTINPSAAALYSEKQIPSGLTNLVKRTLQEQVEADKLATYNIPDLKKIIEESKVKLNLQTIKWGPDGTESSSSIIFATIIGILFTFLIYFFIIFYGSMVMQGIMEEKTNRIVEIIISSVKPFELMMGKILGILLVGLTQVFFWMIIAFSILTLTQGIIMPDNRTKLRNNDTEISEINVLNVNDLAIIDFFDTVSVLNWSEIIIAFILFFIGGYLLFAAIFAAIGAAVDNQEDSQQFVYPISFLLLFAVYAGIYSGENPDGPLAFWCSLLPLTSPVVMMIRLPFSVPFWQLALSLLILFTTSTGIIWIAGRIYRTGILMYGKKPSIKEILKWINYK